MDELQQLRNKGLKATPARLDVIKTLGSRNLAYAHSELESVFGKLDRVTLYRILNDFEEVGLVHKIVDLEGVTRFALCRHSCPGETHVDDHVHFNCQVCHRMFCIEKIHQPALKMPRGFKMAGSQTLVYGLCDVCSAL